ncbi:MAG TPA: hypothetical protein VL737_05060 [Candidatus Pristimantibacillus sp.]|nr:hypothetical protein [Candidatus Pristimantibacillus sp.]
MPELPIRFVDELIPLDSLPLDPAGIDASIAMRERGYEVFLGLRPDEWRQVNALARQRGIQEFCPNDLLQRFGDEEMSDNWVGQLNAFFQLRKIGGSAMHGYGWTDPEYHDTLPDCDNQFAVRLSEELAGQGLGKLFTAAIISGSMALGVRRIGLMTWEDNIAAWKSYEKAGAELITSKPSQRMTIVSSGRRIRRRQITANRLHMQFTQTLTD